MQHRTTQPLAAERPLAQATELRDRLANQLAVTAGFVELLARHGAIPPDLRQLAEAAVVESRKAVASAYELAGPLGEAADADRNP